MIFQELNLVSNLTVAENIFLGREPMNRLGFIDTVQDEPGRRGTPRSTRSCGGADHAAGPTAGRSTADRGNRQGDLQRCPGADHGRTDLGHHRARDRGPFRDHRGAEAARCRDRLHHPQTRGTDPHRRRRGGDARRQIDRRRTAEGPESRRDRADDGRTRDEDRGRTAPAPARGDEALRVEALSLAHPDRPGDFLLRDINLDRLPWRSAGHLRPDGRGRTELLETIFGLHPRASSREASS